MYLMVLIVIDVGNVYSNFSSYPGRGRLLMSLWSSTWGTKKSTYSSPTYWLLVRLCI